MAIAGSPAVAMEMARTLRTTFEYYRRSQLQRMSLAAKIRALSQMLRENLPGTLQGFGIVSPIFCGFEPGRHGHGEKLEIYFYDPLGAHFRAAQFAGSGSGSLSIKSVLKHLDRWGDPRPADLELPDAARLGIRLLMTASELDSATGGVTPEMNSYPTMRLLNRDGIRTITVEEQAEFWLRENAGAAADNAPGGGQSGSSGGSSRKTGSSRSKSAAAKKNQTKGGGSSK
jgi:proteasome beta subunit